MMKFGAARVNDALASILGTIAAGAHHCRPEVCQDCVEAAMNSQLAKNSLHVVPNRHGADEQFIRHINGGAASGQEAQHLLLAA
jgi:hypothetical protein